MREATEQVTSFVLNHMKRTDMRAKEEFKPLDLVRITGSHITGKILKFDADKRLAYVSSTIGDRWWYVKDLELEKQSHAKPQRSQREFLKIEGIGALPANDLLEGARNYLFEEMDFSTAFGVPPRVVEGVHPQW